MDPKTQELLISLIDLAGKTATIYAPALDRLSNIVIDELKELVTAGRKREALSLIRAYMGMDDLAAEKESLLAVATAMAADHAEAGKLIEEIAFAALKLAIGLLLAA